MKKVIFLIIATLLVMGLVLPGCDGNGVTDPREVITIGIAGPMGAAQGDHHYYGAEMAADEVNGSDSAVDGVDVGGTLYRIELVKIDTNEILNPSGADGTTRMEANIADLDYVLGGFRTEAVTAYREVVVGPSGAGKLFINCGAATEELQRSCVSDYANYKPWFKGTPPNEVFLSTSQGKLLTSIVGAVRTATNNDTYEPSIAFMPENAKWTEASRLMTFGSIGPPGKGYLVGGPNPADPADWMWLPSPVATTSEMNILLTDMATYDPDIILTIMSGPCGATFAARVGVYMPDALVYGINVEAQRSDFADLPYAEGMIFLDTWSQGVNYTDKTADFVSGFEAEYDELPIYTAATYDATLALVEAIEGKDSIATADIITWMEDADNAREGTTGVTGYYPQWDTTTTGDHVFFGSGIPALNEAQVLELYPWLSQAKYSPNGVDILDWTWDADDWTMAPHDTHDLVYGTEWVTGVAAQWQDDGGTLKKVGIWPMVLSGALPQTLPGFLAALNASAIDAPTLYYLESLALLWDQYGWWNFAYPGTVDPELAGWIGWLISEGKVIVVP